MRKSGLEPYRTTITPQEGQTQVVEYTLKSAGEARVAGLAPSRTTSLGQPLVLVTGGRLHAMGSPRRELGRRSNETERRVELKRLFYISRFQVTEQRLPRVQGGPSLRHLQGRVARPRAPAGRASGGQDAAAFCNWLSLHDKLPPAYARRGDRLELSEPATMGYRLPTEAEWEFAARFDGSRATRKYPWGNDPAGAREVGQLGRCDRDLPHACHDHGLRRRLSRRGAGRQLRAESARPARSRRQRARGRRTVTRSMPPSAPDYLSIDPVGLQTGDNYVNGGAGWPTGKVLELRLAVRDSGTRPTARPRLPIARYAE